MAFDNNSAPAIQFPPAQYDAGYFNQLVRSINTYFSLLDSTAPTHNSKITSNTICTPYAEITLVNGNNDAIQIPLHTFLRITGPTAAFDVRGINSSPQNVNNGRQLILHNPTANNMIIHNEEVAVTAANRINTMTGTNINISGPGMVYLIYSVKDLRWLVISHQG